MTRILDRLPLLQIGKICRDLLLLESFSALINIVEVVKGRSDTNISCKVINSSSNTNCTFIIIISLSDVDTNRYWPDSGSITRRTRSELDPEPKRERERDPSLPAIESPGQPHTGALSG